MLSRYKLCISKLFVAMYVLDILIYFSIMFYYCKACSSRSRSLKDYVEHYRLHFNEANVKFPCAFNGCVRRFKTYTAFKSHFSRDHGKVRRGESQLAVVDSAVTIQCPIYILLENFRKHKIFPWAPERSSNARPRNSMPIPGLPFKI